MSQIREQVITAVEIGLWMIEQSENLNELHAAVEELANQLRDFKRPIWKEVMLSA